MNANTKTILIEAFNNDNVADERWTNWTPPTYQDGFKVVSARLDYACKANNWESTRIVVIVNLDDKEK